MFNSAYETTPCRDYVVDRIAATIMKQRIVHPNGFDSVKTPIQQKVLSDCIFLNGTINEVPQFGHPLVVFEDDKHQDKNFIVYGDARNFTRIGRENQEVIISARLDYDLLTLRTWLQMVWLKYSPMDLLGISSYPITVYSRWLTEAITKKLALPPEVQMKVSVLVAYFYVCMHYQGTDKAEVTEQQRQQIAQLVARATNVNAADVFNIIDGEDIYWTVSNLIDAFNRKGESIRFNEMNPAFLYTAISGSWFGQNHRELVAVAVEHPVTWLAICAKAVSERGFHNTIIGKVAKLSDRGDIAKVFTQNLMNLPVA